MNFKAEKDFSLAIRKWSVKASGIMEGGVRLHCSRGAGPAQSVERATVDLWVRSSSLTLGVEST